MRKSGWTNSLNKRWDGNMILMILSLVVLVFGGLIIDSFMIKTAFAADISAFEAGFIISDWQMGNYSSMSEAEIQNFLQSKGNCRDTNLSKAWNNLDSFSEASPISWHIKDGHFVCMADEDFNGESAAHIIWQTAQDYRINPQVLIVLLQKEQGLITDSWPNSIQYRSATGYGCPDTAACSEKYYGFKNQLRNAASMFRSVLDGGWSNYPMGERYVQYNPDAGCGGSVVNIRNRATSALYRYTPYQPNAGALAAGYGTAECGAYGNRNFYLYFEDWFGGIKRELPKVTSVDAVDIKEGVYRILNFDATKAVAVENDSEYNGANVLLRANDYRDTGEKWRIKKNEDYYVIENVTTGKALDVANNDMSNTGNVWQYATNYSCAQRWRFVRNVDGSYTIHNACRLEYVLDLQGGKTNLQIYELLNNSNQHWVLSEVVEENFEGVYQITNFGTHDAITIAGASRNDAANIMVASPNDSDLQKWIVKKVDDYYLIINKATGKVFDVANGSYINNANVWQYGENRSCAQRWQFYRDGQGKVTIYNACHPNLALDLQDRRTNIQIYARVGGANQEWLFDKIADEPIQYSETDYSGNYRIVNIESGKTLSVENSDNNNGARIIMEAGVDDALGKWQIKKVDNYYVIKNLKTGKVLDVSNANFNNKTFLWQYDENLSCAQRWNFIRNTDGSVNIQNACYNNFALDLRSGNREIQIYENLNNANQRFRLEKVEIEDFSGVYQILNSGNRKALTIENSSVADAGNVVATKRDGNALDFQSWEVKKIDDYYLIINKATTRLLDVANAIFEDNRNIWQYGENRSCAQRWRLIRNPNNTVTFYNACVSSMALDLQNGDTNLQIYSRVGGQNQEWFLEAVNTDGNTILLDNASKNDSGDITDDFEGVYKIAVANNMNKVLSIADASGMDGVNVQFEQRNGSALQFWQIEKRADYYIIKNQETGKVLDVQNGIYENNRNVWQYTTNYSCAQRFQIVKNPDSSVSFYNACYPNWALDLDCGDKNLQIYAKIEGGVNQKFKLVKE